MKSWMLRKLATDKKVHASAGIIAAAAIGTVWAANAAQPKKKGDDEPCDDSSTYPFWTHQPLLKTTMAPISCRCEKIPQDRNRVMNSRMIQRSATIRRMDAHSTKDQVLDSLYNWNKYNAIGEGAFGSVYVATDRETNEKFALKRIPKVHTDDETFQREMRALLHLRAAGGHPHVCAMREHFDDKEFYYLILDFIGGGEMFEHLIENGAYSERDAARLVEEVANALAFLHGIGVAHADLKPENIMLSTNRAADAVVKLVDFGCSEVLVDDDMIETKARSYKKTPSFRPATPAYCPPELLNRKEAVGPPMDMWALGVILYIMLTGIHPFDLNGEASDEEIEKRIKNKKRYSPPIRNSRITKHISESAIDLIERLMERNPKKRLTALEMLDHPWVRGETAKTDIIKGSDERLSKVRVIKSKLQAKFFSDVVDWSDNEDDIRRKTSLIEKSFQSYNVGKQGTLSTKDLGRGLEGSNQKEEVNTDEGSGPSLSMSDFSNLLSENMKNKYFPTGEIVYEEGDLGHHMYFINSGTITVSTKDGSVAERNQGDFFGEGALLHPKKIRSATIRCKTPVNAFQISREYFEKYINSSESALLLTLREKDKIRKRNRAKTILRLQKELKEQKVKKNEFFFKEGESVDSMFILENGKVDITLEGNTIFSGLPGNIFGEHSVMMGKQRNCSAKCVSKDGCIAQELFGRNFRHLMDASPNMKISMRDLCLRREFKKAVVFRLQKEFPYLNPKEAFDAVDEDRKGVLDTQAIKRLMRDMDPTYNDNEIEEIIRVLDLCNSGTVSFDEFKKVFIANIRTSASI